MQYHVMLIGLDISKNFHYPTLQIYHFSTQVIYDKKYLKFYLPETIGQSDMSSPRALFTNVD